MTKQLKTVNLQGKEYAQVSERIKLFREECPNGLIETKPTIQEDGQILFSARILKNKAKPTSGEGTGHALGKNSGQKAFEKLETIAVGRALAMLGYMASGEVASSEEMQEFLDYKDQRIEEVIDILNAAQTIDELRDLFLTTDLMAEKKVIEAKDKRKEELQKGVKTNEAN